MTTVSVKVDPATDDFERTERVAGMAQQVISVANANRCVESRENRIV
jgi:hypothetical protein